MPRNVYWSLVPVDTVQIHPVLALQNTSDPYRSRLAVGGNTNLLSLHVLGALNAGFSIHEDEAVAEKLGREHRQRNEWVICSPAKAQVARARHLCKVEFPVAQHTAEDLRGVLNSKVPQVYSLGAYRAIPQGLHAVIWSAGHGQS